MYSVILKAKRTSAASEDSLLQIIKVPDSTRNYWIANRWDTNEPPHPTISDISEPHVCTYIFPVVGKLFFEIVKIFALNKKVTK